MDASINCSVCGSDKIKKIVSLQGDKTIYACKRCSNAFTFPNPIIPDYAAEDFQARDGDTDRLTLYNNLPEEIQESYEKQLSMVEGKLSKGASILEIGGGEGIFLELLKQKGYDVELVEPSNTASLRAKKRALNVHTDYIQNITFNKTFSLICMSHVLEHMADPIDSIIRMKPLLAPRGFILLAQTNFKGFMPLFLKQNWYAWVPDQHFSHFSLPGLRYIADKTSMVVAEYKYSRLVHGPSIYHQALKYFPFLQDQIHILLQLK